LKETARFFKVLADEARLKMLWLLFNNRELCVCDIMAVLEITQSKASRHLAALRNAGLAADRKDGLWSYYSLLPVRDDLAKAHLKLLRASLSKRRDAAPLLAKLKTWLKAKNGCEPCLENSGRMRLTQVAKRRPVRTQISGELR
jgi:ArsR family transcriptional regulator